MPGTGKRKRPVGRPATGKNEMIAIRWERPLLDGIDRYAEQQMLRRPMALRQIVTRFLARKGMLKVKKMFRTESRA